MIEFTINTDTYFLPTSWNEVKYTQYQEIHDLEADECLSGTDKAMRILSILSKVPMATLQAAGFGIVVPIFNHLDFLKTKPAAIPIEHVTVLGVNYYAQDIATMGELGAYDRIESVFDEKSTWKAPYKVALLLRKRLETPVKQRVPSWIQRIFGRQDAAADLEIQYESFDNDFKLLEKRAKLFASQLSPPEIYGLDAFFLQKGMVSTNVSRSYSEVIHLLPAMKESLANISAKNTGGWLPSMIWNRMYCFILRCYVWTLTQSLTSSNITRK